MTNRQKARVHGPHVGAVAIVALLLTLAAVAAPILITGQHPYIDPAASAAEAAAQAAERGMALQLSGFLLAGASIPVAICAAVWAAALRRRGLTVPGPTIALAGGLLAAGSLLTCGITQWAVGRSGSSLDPATAVLAAQLSFGLGGVGFAVPFGVMLAGVAVPGLLARALPAPLAWAGLCLAALAEVSWFALLTPVLFPVLPVARFGGLAWLVLAGAAGGQIRKER